MDELEQLSINELLEIGDFRLSSDLNNLLNDESLADSQELFNLRMGIINFIKDKYINLLPLTISNIKNKKVQNKFLYG